MQTSEIEENWLPQHPTMVLFGIAAIIRANIFPLILGGYGAYKGWPPFLLYGLIFISLAWPSALLILRFFTYRYQLTAGQIIIKEGVFSKKTRSIPVQRIHNINTSQSLFGRMFGVVRIDIETAGGAQAEASLSSVSNDAARAIQEYINKEKHARDPQANGFPLLPGQTADEDAEPNNGEEVFKMSVADVILAGATTSKMGMIFLGIALVFQYFEDQVYNILPESFFHKIELLWLYAEKNPLNLVLLLLAIFFVLFFVAWLISIPMAMVRWFGFTLRAENGDLNVRMGLFTIKSFSIPRDKVQALKCSVSPIRRPLGFAKIQVRSAGGVGVEGQNRSESNLLAPLSRGSDINTFVKAVWQNAGWDRVLWNPVHPFTRFQNFRDLMLLLLIPTVLVFFLNYSFPHRAMLSAGIFLVGGILAWMIAHFTYKQTAYAYDSRFVYIKNGFFGLSYWVIPIGKIQGLAMRQNPFQRRRRLVSLDLDVAGASGLDEAAIPNIDIQEGWRLFNLFSHPTTNSSALAS